MGIDHNSFEPRISPGANCSQKKWDSIFGKPETITEKPKAKKKQVPAPKREAESK